MNYLRRFIFLHILLMGGFSSSLFFISLPAQADTITLKNDKNLKGLVVERHWDRVIFSTEKGEIPILLSGIKKIEYDDPEQNFMQIGRAYEAENKYGEALAYYEKAIEINPNFEEAKKAAASMKSRFWAQTTEGPQSEMDKQQEIADSWGEGHSGALKADSQVLKDEKILRENLGLTLIKKGDWVRVGDVSLRGDLRQAGLRRDDCLVAIDAESLRYLDVAVVTKKMLYPHYSSFILEYERDCLVEKGVNGLFQDLGLKLKLGPEGVLVAKLSEAGAAALAGIKEGDFVSRVNGQSTRYMPLGKVVKIIQDRHQGAVTLSVRRSTMLTRK